MSDDVIILDATPAKTPAKIEKEDESKSGDDVVKLDSPPPAKKAKLDDQKDHAETIKEKSESRKKPNEAATHEAGHFGEKDAGITEYISTHKGFSAVIKQRYSDFIVNEISEAGEVIHVTSTDIPDEKEETEEVEKPSSDDLSEADQEKLQKLLDNPDPKAKDFIELPVECDKDTRTKMHKAIKTLFPSLNSNTVEEDGKKRLRISKMKMDKRERPNWKAGRGQVCRFVLYKENKDTMDAISLIARLARLKPNLFRYAGTKDKRAKTSQEITAYRVTANKLEALNARLRNMMVGNFRYVKEPLTLGQLKGNKFTIVLRNVTGSDDQISAGMSSLKSVGFINYYGMQRFGTTSIPTHHIGRELLLGNWEEAVDLILKPRAGEDESMQACREAWGKSRNVSEALRLAPGHHNIEKTLLQTLLKQGETSYASALQAIPRNTRLMYVHAYQSYVWNKMTSLRLQKFGYKVKVGDLVLSRNKSNNKEGDEKKTKPTVITEDNQSEYSIQDVVLPLPGYDVIYPDGEVGDCYKSLMDEDGLDIDNMKQKHKDYSLSGDYRHLVVTPGDVTWEVIPYNDVTVALCQGDLDVMFNKPKPKAVEDGKYRALKIEMSLPASCYATMALRELLKMDTSAAYQATLNVT